MSRLILITGATGYVGRRLAQRLVRNPEYRLRLLVRNPGKVRDIPLEHVHVVQGDTLRPESLKPALAGVHTAYYLIHSMGAGSDYRSLERQSATHFREACIAAGVKRIIYLGGLGNKDTASPHLLSRIKTGEILSEKAKQVQTIWLRAAVIIGSGSASFEIIRHLLQKLPIMTTPLWVKTRTQPIGIEDVLAYLEASLGLSHQGNLQVDIGTGVMNFGEMLRAAGRVMGLKRLLIPVPLFSPRLSSYWLILMTPVDFRIAGQLVEGLRSETVLENDHAARYFPDIHPQSYSDMVESALREIEHDQVVSWRPERKRQASARGSAARAVRHDSFRREIPSSVFPEDIFLALQGFDSPDGWFRQSRLWELRRLMDRMVHRGPVSYWEVAQEQPGKRLLLLSRMRLPGKAWLDFGLTDRTLRLTAHFFPRGMGGRMYWLLFRPCHRITFPATLNMIFKKARHTATGID